MADEKLDPTADPKTLSAEVDEALDMGPPDETPETKAPEAEAPSDPVTDSVKAEATGPVDESEGKSQDEAEPAPASEDTDPAIPGDVSASTDAAEAPSEVEAEPSAQPGLDEAPQAAQGEDEAKEPEPEASEASEAPEPEAPAKPDAPKFGDVKGEVAELSDHLSGDTLDTLRAGGCSLFLFLADMAECDTSGLSQEGKARITNVRNQAQVLLAAIESVFVRHG